MTPIFNFKKGRVRIELDPEAHVDIVHPKINKPVCLHNWYKIFVDGKLMCRIHSFHAAYREAKIFASAR